MNDLNYCNKKRTIGSTYGGGERMNKNHQEINEKLSLKMNVFGDGKSFFALHPILVKVCKPWWEFLPQVVKLDIKS